MLCIHAGTCVCMYVYEYAFVNVYECVFGLSGRHAESWDYVCMCMHI